MVVPPKGVLVKKDGNQKSSELEKTRRDISNRKGDKNAIGSIIPRFGNRVNPYWKKP